MEGPWVVPLKIVSGDPAIQDGHHGPTFIIVSDIPARHQICLPEKKMLTLLCIEVPHNVVDKRPHNVFTLLYYVHRCTSQVL